VRSSWLTRERNSDLAWLAASAPRQVEFVGARAFGLVGAHEQEADRSDGPAAGRRRVLRRRRTHRRHGQRHVDARAVLAKVRPVAHLVALAGGDGGDRLAALHRPPELRRQFLAALGQLERVVHAQRTLLAQHLFGPITQHLLGAAIEQSHDMVGVHRDDRDLGGGVQQGLQFGLRQARGALLFLRAVEEPAQLHPQRMGLLAAEVDVGLARLVVDEVGGGPDELAIGAGLALCEPERGEDDDHERHQHGDANDAGQPLDRREQRTARLRDQHVPTGAGGWRHRGQPALAAQADLAGPGIALQRAPHELHVSEVLLPIRPPLVRMQDHAADAVEHDQRGATHLARETDLLRHLVQRQVGNHQAILRRRGDVGHDAARQRRQEGVGPDGRRGPARARVERTARQVQAFPLLPADARVGPDLGGRHDTAGIEQQRRLQRRRGVQHVAQRVMDFGRRGAACARGRAGGGLARRGDEQFHLRAHQQRGALVFLFDVVQRLRDRHGAPQHDDQQQRHARQQHVLARQDALERSACRPHGALLPRCAATRASPGGGATLGFDRKRGMSPRRIALAGWGAARPA
jgi:hypothetical protein